MRVGQRTSVAVLLMVTGGLAGFIGLFMMAAVAYGDSTWVPEGQPQEFIGLDDWSALIGIVGKVPDETRNLTGGANLQFGVRPGCTDDFEFVDVDFFTDDCDKGGSVIPVNVEIEPFFDYPDNEGDGFGIEDPLKLLTSRIPPGTPVMWPLRMVFAPANPLTVNVELTTSEIVDIPGEPTTRVVLLEGRPEDNGAEIGDFRTTNPIVIPVTLTGALTRDFTVKVFVGEVPLSAPTLLNPPDDAPTSGDTPLFQWNASAGDPDNYQLQVAKTGDIDTGPYVVDKGIAPPGTSDETTTLTEDGVYQWRVIAEKTGKTPATSDLSSFTLDTFVAPPVLVSPAEGEALTDPAPLLDWGHPDTADVLDYILRVTSGDIITGDLVIDDLVITGSPAPTSFQIDPQSPLADGAYQWQVTASDDLFNAADSVVGNFTVDTTAPTPPVLVFPGSGGQLGIAEVGLARTVAFVWEVSTSSDVLRYHLQVTSGDEFNTDIDEDQILHTGDLRSGDQIVFTDDLPGDGIYKWRVGAVDIHGNEIASGDLEVREFSVDATRPVAPALVLPLQNELLGIDIVDLERAVDFEWTHSASDDIDRYHLQVTTGGGTFNTIVNVFPGSGDTGSTHNMPFDGAFKWRVGAIDAFGNETVSGDLDVRSFEIDTVPPLDPFLLSPLELINDNTPLLDWDHPNIADVVEYFVFVYSGDFSQALEWIITGDAPNPPATQFQIPDQDALADESYLWEVWALDLAQNESFSDTGDFIVDTDIVAPILTKPAEDATVGNFTPTFEWTHVGDANTLTHYLRVSSGDIGNPPEFEREIQTNLSPVVVPSGVLPVDPVTGTADYFWQVVVTDGVNTAESPARHFIIDLNVPVIGLDSPVPPDNILTSGDIVFRWSAVDLVPLFAAMGIGIQAVDPDVYDLRVAWATGDLLNDFFFQRLDILHTGDRGAQQVFPLPPPPAPLDDGQYIWGVRGKKDTLVGDFTEALFIVDLIQPGTPVPQSPPDGSKISDNQPDFEWSSVADTSGVSYLFELSDTGDFVAPVITGDLAESSLTPAGELLDGDYMWRVRAIDGAGRISAFSTVFNVTIDTEPPPAPELVGPADGVLLGLQQVGPNRTVNFEWDLSASGDVAQYHFQVTTGGVFNTVFDEFLAHPSTGATRNLPLDGEYQWRVGAVDDTVGDVPANPNETDPGGLDVRTFEIDITPPGVPTDLATTPVGPSISDDTPLFSWSAATGDVVKYRLLVTSGDIDTPPPRRRRARRRPHNPVPVGRSSGRGSLPVAGHRTG